MSVVHHIGQPEGAKVTVGHDDDGAMAEIR